MGTLNFFHAAGHEQHGLSGRATVFNVTNTVNALLAKGLLTTTPAVTLVRHGAEPDAAVEHQRQHPHLERVKAVRSFVRNSLVDINFGR